MRPLSARAQVRLVRLCYLLPVLNALYDREAFLEEAESWM